MLIKLISRHKSSGQLYKNDLCDFVVKYNQSLNAATRTVISINGVVMA